MLEPGDGAPAFTLLDQNGEKVRLSNFKGQTLVLFSTPASTRPAAPPRPAEFAIAAPTTRGWSEGDRRLARRGEGGRPVRRQVRPRLHPPRRRRSCGRREVRYLGREVDVRQEVHGRAAGDLHHRPRRQDRQGLSKGSAQKARPPRAEG